MAITVAFIVALIVFVCVVLAATNRCPLWVPVMIMAILALLQSSGVGLR